MQARGQPGAAWADPRRPLVLAEPAPGGPRVACLNAAARQAGIAAGQSLADARARAGRALQVRPADPAGDDRALRALALWATRYTPRVSIWGEAEEAHGLHLDIEGAAHLLGGEAALMADLARRLSGFGLLPRLACAGTPGLGYGLARYGQGDRPIIASGQEAEALAALPIRALRVDVERCAVLHRLGLRQVGDLMGRPRAPLARRFGRDLLRRLDQALGREPDPLIPLAEPAAYGLVRRLAEPVAAQDALVAVAAGLMRELAPRMERDGVGARAISLGLYRVDGAAATIALGLSRPTRDPAHVARLLALRLERQGLGLDPGFGFDALRLDVTRPERLIPAQAGLTTESEAAEDRTALADRLRQRLGAERVRRLWPQASHLPERACLRRPLGAGMGEGRLPDWPLEAPGPRPLLLLAEAEPAEVAVAGPHEPPRRFRWRRRTHLVLYAEGPERIAAEWWRGQEATRDYYVVEDREGRRFWLYRELEASRWFVHGLFA